MKSSISLAVKPTYSNRSAQRLSAKPTSRTPNSPPQPCSKPRFKTLLPTANPYFINVWTEFTSNMDNPTEITARQQMLIALAQRNPHFETSDESTTARHRLLRYHAIKRDGDIDKIEIFLFE